MINRNIQLTRWKRFAPALLLLTLAAFGGSARAIDRDKLRQSVPLPRLDVNFVNFNFGNQPDAAPDEAGVRAQIAALEAAPPKTSQGLMQLGRLYWQVKDYAHSRATYASAIAISREATLADPDDLVSLSELCEALKGAGQLPEAEATLRRAVKIAPQNAGAWTKLGEVLLTQASQTLFPGQDGFTFDFGATKSFGGLSEAQLDSRPTPEAIKRAQAFFDEAGASFERAVQVAPLDPQVYLERMGFRSRGAFFGGVLQTLSQRPDEAATLKVAMSNASQTMQVALFSTENVADLQAVARLKPDDVSANGAAATSTLLFSLARNGRQLPLKNGLDSLPASDVALIREAMGRLETLAGNGGGNQAEALEVLGGLRFLLEDPSATDTLRRAVALDPTRSQAINTLAVLLSKAKAFDELVPLLQRQVQREDTARNHLMLAKVYDKMNRPQDVATQVSAAMERDPDDQSANLARFALLLRADDLAKANGQLVRTAKLLASPNKPSPTQTSDFALLTGGFMALSGKTDTAKQLFQRMVASDAQNEDAQKLLAALNP